MSKAKHIALALALCFSQLFYSRNTVPQKKSSLGRGIRVSLGPAIGFYSINKNHAKSIFPGFSGAFSYKKETRFGRDFRTFFLYGVDYFCHTINFQSYYFTQDTLQLYDKKMVYKYALFLQEINLPFQVKYSVNRENNSQYTQYFMIGYHLRYILPANLKVTQNGKDIIEDQVEMKFKNHLFARQMNAYLSASFGWQKNNTASSKAGFFIELNYRYGFSPYYFEEKYAASSLFINSSHLTLQLGVKF